MNIGIIGSGRIGGTLAKLFARLGHSVAVSNSRGPDSLAALIEEIGPNARATSVDEAATFGEVVLLAIPWRVIDGGLPSREILRGKIVIDAMNPYSETGGTLDLGASTSSEEVAKRLPGARIVKAFNTMYFQTLATEGRESQEGRLVIFLAGDDAEAKGVVSGLIDEIGFAPVDTGSLRDGGKKQEPNTPIYNTPMTADRARELLATTA